MTMRFLVDEDMPRSTARVLREAGFEAEDVRDAGLRGHSDEKVFAYAQSHTATLISADKGFSNPWRFPPHEHAGIVLVRLPDEMPTTEVNRELLKALATLTEENLKSLLIVVEPGRVRIRRYV